MASAHASRAGAVVLDRSGGTIAEGLSFECSVVHDVARWTSIMSSGHEQYVRFLATAVRIVKTESPAKTVLVVLHPTFLSTRPLKWRNASAILKPLVREHRAHTAFMSTGHPVMHEVQYLGIGVAVVTRP